MVKYNKMIEAQILRKKGFPINKIAETLKVSKGSVSLWCRDVIISEKLKDKIRVEHYKKTEKGRLMGAQMNKNKRLASIEKADIFGIENINKLNKKEVILIATALYWSEGSKSDMSSGFRFVNSDPKMILFMRDFLIKYMEIKNSELTCSIQINEVHRSRIVNVLSFWKNLLELEDQQIRKPYFVKTKNQKIYKNSDNYYGICKLIVKKSTNLKYIMLGLIKALKGSEMSA
jgi:hypothetical protein